MIATPASQLISLPPPAFDAVRSYTKTQGETPGARRLASAVRAARNVAHADHEGDRRVATRRSLPRAPKPRQQGRFVDVTV